MVPSDIEIEIRSLETHEEFQACVRLQQLTWGPGYGDIVPASLLKVSQKIAGIVAGAFLPNDRLVAFVYGLTGVDGGRLLHWSHMLAVRDDLRNRGIGRKLKKFQADRIRSEGVEEMRWTFDPLVARNAHLNLGHLEVQVKDYVPHMYAETGSGLHSFGTDRFVVAWALGGPGTGQTGLVPPDRQATHSGGEKADEKEAPRSRGKEGNAIAAMEGTDRMNEAPLAIQPGKGGAPPSDDQPLPDVPIVRIPIPPDVETLCQVSPDEANAWRRVTRRAFLHYLERGYRIVHFQRGPGTPAYLLRLGEES